MKSLCALFIIFLTGLNVQSQTVTISGKITDQEGKPVPFVSIYLKNTSNGTSANIDGDYQLKIPTGNHTLVFKAIGYRPENKEINVKADQQFHVTLTQAVYELQDVVIRSGGEDPAYAIIRSAIKKRRNYLREVNSYTTDVYIKGLQKLVKAPKKFLGTDIDKAGKQMGLDSNRSGIIYLSESESKLSFIQPDNFREEMISSKVSGNNQTFSFNRASEIKVNLYENLQNWGSLSNRPFISPISDNALSYYTYKLVGTTVENGEFINKIEVLPKRSTDPVFRGHIYILEDSWRLHSIDLYMTKEANLNFIDTLKINQQFFPINDQVWMPSSVKFDFKGDILGFRFTGYYLAIYRNYNLSPPLNPKDFAEFLRITKEVNTKDSVYWNSARPIPLTDEESNDYKKKEILAAKRESKLGVFETCHRFKTQSTIHIFC
ncbi:MAG: DUF5686 and carboxypeptidase regulatory-like domain-containing protein [Daejeonella sp.]